MNENKNSYDNVDRPQQYNLDKISVNGGNVHNQSIQPLDYSERLLTGHDFSGFEGAMVMNVVKYVSRFPFKGKPIEDLKKAQFYINRLVAHEEALEQQKQVGLTPATNNESSANDTNS